MLERTEHDNGVVTYQSPLLRDAGVLHAFSTRIGGTSRDGYASLNLGLLRKDFGDANTRISENFRRLRAATGLQRFMRYEVNQVHGRSVWLAPVKPVRLADAPDADAIVTDLPQRMLTVRTADCVAILLYDGQRIGAIHAGWRGLVAGVIENTLTHFCPQQTIAAIGPAISVGHFEVGQEVAAAFTEAGLADVVQPGAEVPGAGVPGAGGRLHVDLPKVARILLEKSGVLPGQIDRTDRCTYRDEADFYSYRRDVTHRNGCTGHMAAVIGLNGTGPGRCPGRCPGIYP